MKKFVVLLFFLSFAELFSAWENVGNTSRILVSSDSIDNYGISDDSKFIFTLSHSNVLTKWDVASGNEIWAKNLKLPQTSLFSKISLSNDCKTYTFSYIDYIHQNDFYTTRYYIFEIETDNLLDSIIDRHKIFNNSYLVISDAHSDYLYDQKSLVSYFNYFDDYGGPGIDLNSGLFSYYIKNGSPSDTSFLYEGNIDFLKINKSANLIYIAQSINEKISNIPNGNYRSDIVKTNLLFSLSSIDTTQINYYYDRYDLNSDNSTTKQTIGVDYNFQPAIFINGNRLILPSGKLFYLYSMTERKLLTSKLINLNLPDYSISYYNSSDSDFYYVTHNSMIYTFSANNFGYCSEIAVDSIKNISSLKSSPDGNFLLLNNGTGYIYKIDKNDVWKLKSNFGISDSTVIVGDTMSFYDNSVGYPDSFFWDFGDGQTSTEKKPSHVYADTGIYTVKHIVYKGGNKDSVIKYNCIKVYPKLIAKFDYSIEGTYPVTLKLQNNSIGDIDSVLWKFSDSPDSKLYNPVLNFKFNESLKVTLYIFQSRFTDSISAIISIKVNQPALNNTKIEWELTGDSLKSGTAIKGYKEPNDIIVYHIMSDSINFKGAANLFGSKLWQDSSGVKYSSLLRRNDGTYISIEKNQASILNSNGMVSKSLTIESNRKTPAVETNNNTSWFIAGQDKGCQICSVKARWVNGTLDSEQTLDTKYDNIFSMLYLSKANDYSVFCCKSLIDSARWDYIYNFHLSYVRIYDNLNQTVNDLVINKIKLPFRKVSDFIRLNKYLLVFSSSDSIFFFKNGGLNPADASELNDSSNNLNYYVFEGFEFKNLLKLNDTIFVASGNYMGSPGFILIDSMGKAIDSVVVAERMGSFEYASVTPEANLLFSGYRFKEINVKRPYFVITRDSIITKLINPDFIPSPIDIDSVSTLVNQITVFPNPSTNEITIAFSLEQKADVSLEIYDNYGNLTASLPAKNFTAGNGKINYNMILYSEGLYNAVLTINGKERRFGKFLIIR